MDKLKPPEEKHPTFAGYSEDFQTTCKPQDTPVTPARGDMMRLLRV